MKIIFRYACKQFIERPTWRWNWRNNNFAFYDAYFYERIIFQLSVNCKGFWYSEGKAIAPFLNFCEHKVISFCVYNKDTPFCWIFQVLILLQGECQRIALPARVLTLPAVATTRAGVDSVWEQGKLKVGKMLENAARRRRRQSHTACTELVEASGAPTYDAGVLFRQRNRGV